VEPQLPNRRWVRVSEAAAYLQVSQNTVLRLIHEGRLEAFRPAKRDFRVMRDSLLKYVDKKIEMGPELDEDGQWGWNFGESAPRKAEGSG